MSETNLDPAQTAESLEYLALGLGAVSFVLWLILQ